MAIEGEVERRRLINANRVGLFGGDASRMLALICECGESDCRESVLMTSSDYEARPSDVVHVKHLTAQRLQSA